MKPATLYPTNHKNLRSKRVLSKLPVFLGKAKWIWFFVLVLFVIWFLLFKTNLFLIRKVEFISNNSKFDLNISSDVDYNHYFINKHFFELNPSDYTYEIKKASPFIKNVYIEKRFPDAIVIYVYYYSPDYLIYEDDKCFLASDLDYIFFEDSGHKCDVWANDSTLRVFNQEDDFLLEKNQNTIEDFFKIKKVFTFAGWHIEEIDIENKKYFVQVGDKKLFVIDMAEPLDVQLKKVLILTDTIVNYNYEEFKVFLGYEKPFLEKY